MKVGPPQSESNKGLLHSIKKDDKVENRKRMNHK